MELVGTNPAREKLLQSLFAARKNPIVRDMTNLLWGQLLLPGQKVLQVECGPGKLLLWSALYGRAEVTGIESSSTSFAQAERHFRDAHVKADLRCEDILATTLAKGSFDFVYSINAITHLTGQKLVDAVHRHVELANKHGIVNIVVPNLQSVYGLALKWRDPEAYEAGAVLTKQTLLALAPKGQTAAVHYWGKFTTTVMSHYPPRSQWAAYIMDWLDMLGALQPFRIGFLCPWLVLRIRRI